MAAVNDLSLSMCNCNIHHRFTVTVMVACTHVQAQLYEQPVKVIQLGHLHLVSQTSQLVQLTQKSTLPSKSFRSIYRRQISISLFFVYASSTN